MAKSSDDFIREVNNDIKRIKKGTCINNYLFPMK